MKKLREGDPQLADLRTVIQLWHETFGAETVTVKKLIDNATPQLLEALLAVAGDGGKVNNRRLGRWLRRNMGRVVSGRAIEQRGEKNEGALWRIAPI